MQNIDFLFNVLPIIQCENYKLRMIEDKDFIDIYEIYSDEENAKYARISTIKTYEEAKSYVEHLRNGYTNREFLRWCISTENEDKLIGLISVHKLDYNNSTVQIGYVLNKKYWKKGIMKTCLSKMIDYLFDEINIERIEASIHPDNLSSIYLIERIGFIKKGLINQCSFNKETNKYEGRYIYFKNRIRT